MNNPYGKKDEIYGAETLHREIGYYVSRLEQYSRSLKFFDEAIKKTPDDLRALFGRSRARAKDIQYEGAMEDINHALSLYPDDMGVLADKALNTYLCCEFEESLVQNSRLLPRRKKPDIFRMGVMRCTDAIENCLGERTGRPLRDHFRIIRNLAWKRNYQAQKPFEPVAKDRPKKGKFRLLQRIEQEKSAEPVQPKLIKIKTEEGPGAILDSLALKASEQDVIPPYDQPFPFRPLQYYTTNIKNYMAEKYLNKMYLDKIFLEHFDHEIGARCPNKKGSIKLRQIARDCYRKVSYKQELMRSRRPFYFIKYHEARKSGTLKEREKVELAHQRHMAKKEADAILQKMLAAYEDKKLRDFLKLVEKLREYCAEKPRRQLPNKAFYIDVIYDTVSKAFYDVYRVNKTHSTYEQNRRIYATLGIPLSREVSTDSVITEFKNMIQDQRKQIREFERRLVNAVVPAEICWFYHELSRLHMEQKQFDLARVYAKKCIQQSAIIKNEIWILNSAMLMCKSNMMQHNKSDAKQDLNIAMKSAQKLGDNVKIAYIKQCMDVVESVEYFDSFGIKELEKREKKIVNMMTGTNMKDEVAHLFRQMAAMPASRRMTVIPGVTIGPKDAKTSSRARKMSIMPASRDQGSLGELKRVSSRTSNQSTKGRNMLNFIDLHM